MIATVFSALAFAAGIAALGVGIAATLIGAIVAVVAQPGDWSIAVPPRAAGVTSALLGLLIFVAAATLLAKSKV
jgi:hypothetical protein